MALEERIRDDKNYCLLVSFFCTEGGLLFPISYFIFHIPYAVFHRPTCWRCITVLRGLNETDGQLFFQDPITGVHLRLQTWADQVSRCRVHPQYPALSKVLGVRCFRVIPLKVHVRLRSVNASRTPGRGPYRRLHLLAQEVLIQDRRESRAEAPDKTMRQTICLDESKPSCISSESLE